MRVPRLGRLEHGTGARRRWRPPGRYTPLFISAALVSAIAVPALAGVPPGLPHRYEPHSVLSRVPVTAQSKPAPGSVTLLTGERVTLAPGPGGRSAVSVSPPAHGAAASAGIVDAFSVGGDVYAVPGYALPYLGSRLDPRLFDVSYLKRAGYASLSSLPLSVSWRSAQHAPVPGLTAPAAGGATGGSVPAAAAASFGRALAASLRSGGVRTTQAGAFGQIAKVSLAATPAARQAAPAVPLRSAPPPAGAELYTLTIKAIDRGGKPGYGLIAVQDAGDFRRYHDVAAITPDSPLTISVPAGSYAIEAGVNDLGFGEINPLGSAAFIPIPQVTVSHDTIVTADARQAKPVTVRVPDNTATEIAGISYSRVSAAGGGISGVMYGFGTAPSDQLPAPHLYAKPVPAPSAGSLGFSDSWELQPPDSGLGGADMPFTYNLDFASAKGVPAALSHTLTAADLATVRDNFAGPQPGAGMYSAAEPFHAWSALAFALTPVAIAPFPVPTTRTDYFGGSASTVWDQGVSLIPADGAPVGPVYGPLRTFRAGQRLTMTWGNGPSLPMPQWQDMGLPAGSASIDGVAKDSWSYVCPVCQQGAVMSFNATLSGDADPTHTRGEWGYGSGVFGSASGPSDSVRFYRNGVLTQASATSGQLYPLLPGKATYRIDWASTQATDWTQLASSTDSVWTFTASGTAKPARLPSYELCSPAVNQACSYLPLVFASYDFGTGQQAAPGTQTFTVTGFHQPGEQGPAVKAAAVRVSFDDGKTWAPATSVASAGGGKFTVTVTAPASTSGYASVKVTLTDAAGDSLRQTIMRAYALTSNSTQGR